MDFKNGFIKTKKLFMRFWRSENGKVSLVRDVFIAFLFVFIILLALWGYTGQWFGAPMVAIESGSMMHDNEPYGRIGTINAGDMVLLVKVDGKDDIHPYITSEYENYGKYGDVVVYKPDGNENADQIIHRAMCWVEVYYEDGVKKYTFEGTDYEDINATEPVYLKGLGLWDPSDDSAVNVSWFTHSGFITKGDNPNTNEKCDQIGGISRQPVKVEWISGKASGELPWIGTINLFFNDIISGKNTLGNVPGDCLQCLVILIVVLVSIPVGLDIVSYYKGKKKKKPVKPYKTSSYNDISIEKKIDNKETSSSYKEISIEEKIDNKLSERFGKK